MLLYLLALIASVFSTQVAYSDIPKINPVNTLVSIQTTYTFSTFVSVALTSASYFLIDFTTTNILVNNGPLTCSYLNQTTSSQVTFSSNYYI
jgi:hypothetical protein